MDAEKVVGIGASAVVLASLLSAWVRPRPKPGPEPVQDPESQYSPAGTQLLKGIRSRIDPPETERERQLRGWGRP